MTDAPAHGGDSTEGVRLQKVLAAAGVASRRVSEQLIVEGRVEVNGRIVTELGSRIDPATDLVAVDGVAVQLGQHQIEHEQIRLERAKFIERGFAIVRRFDFVSFFFQIESFEFDNIFFVIYEE